MLASFGFCIITLLLPIFGCHVVMRLGNCSAHPLILLYHRGSLWHVSSFFCIHVCLLLSSILPFVFFVWYAFDNCLYMRLQRFSFTKGKKKYVNHQFVIFVIILRHHHGISSFSCIHGKRRPSGNENGRRQSKQWLCWDHSMSLESFVSHKLNKETCQFVIFLNILRHHQGISFFSYIHERRSPSSNETGHR